MKLYAKHTLYATKTKGRYRGRKVLVIESVYPITENRIAQVKERLIFNSLEFDRNVRMETK